MPRKQAAAAPAKSAPRKRKARKQAAEASLGLSARECGGAHLPDELEPLTAKEARHVVLGHLQRGGSPSAYDRVLAARFGCHAVDVVRAGQSDVMVALRSPDIVTVPLEEVVGKTRFVPLDGDLVRTARDLGMCLGD